MGPVVGAEFPITEAAEAHRLLDSGETVGKVLLTIPDRAATDPSYRTR